MQSVTLRCAISGNHLGGEIMHILLVPTWQQHALHARPVRREHLMREAISEHHQRSSSEVIIRGHQQSIAST